MNEWISQTFASKTNQLWKAWLSWEWVLKLFCWFLQRKRPVRWTQPRTGASSWTSVIRLGSHALGRFTIFRKKKKQQQEHVNKWTIQWALFLFTLSLMNTMLLQAQRMSPLYHETSEPQGSPCGHAGPDSKRTTIWSVCWWRCCIFLRSVLN